MPQVAFPYTTFTDPSGTPLSNGYVLISVSQDAKSPNGSICGGMETRVNLDANGAMISVPQVWPVASLQPGGAWYLYSAYAADGQLALGPESVAI